MEVECLKEFNLDFHISLFHLALFPGMPFSAASCCLWGGSASAFLPGAVVDAGYSPVCSSLLQRRRARASHETCPQPDGFCSTGCFTPSIYICLCSPSGMVLPCDIKRCLRERQGKECRESGYTAGGSFGEL